MKDDKTRKILLIIRIVLWVLALVATIYWIYWSFHLYTLGYYDEHAYAQVFRPIFGKSLLISLLAAGVAFALRVKSDRIKDRQK